MAVTVDSSNGRQQHVTPIVDLGRLLDPHHHAEGIEMVREALVEWGFVEFINHGVSDHVLDAAFKVAQDFFELPADEKAKSWQNLEGIVPSLQPGYCENLITMEGIKRLKEHFLFICFRKPGLSIELGRKAPFPNAWPEKPESFREEAENVHRAMGVVSEQLYGVFSEALGLEPSYIRDHFFTENILSARPTYLHHYPQTDNAPADAVPPHEDGSVFTIVVQSSNIDGLQIWHENEWVTISPQKYSLIVNSGDVLKVWSNGEFQSMTHRVVNSEAGSRFSLAYFVVPAREEVVEPIQDRLAAGVEAKYKSFKFSQLANLGKSQERKKVDSFLQEIPVPPTAAAPDVNKSEELVPHEFSFIKST